MPAIKFHCSCFCCSLCRKYFLAPFIMLAFSLLISQTYSSALPDTGADTFSSGSRVNRSWTVPNASADLFASPDRKQRFCLNRLKDALHVVCSSGSATNLPLYFNPSEYTSSSNDSDAVPFNGGVASVSRNLRNDIPTIALPSYTGRRVPRRRSRRNIVRECCEKPCSYNSLRKYCSPALRFPVYSGQPSDNQPDYRMSYQPATASQQCVTVAELQSFYMKFFRKQWKKDNHGPVPKAETNSEETPRNAPNFAESFSKSQRKQVRESIPPVQVTNEESRVDNEIDERAEENGEGITSPRSRNVMTAPPMRHLVNLPIGTNDYMY